MSARGRLILGVILAVSGLFASGPNAYGFCFAPQLQVSDEFYVSDLVVAGTVIRSREIFDADDPGYNTGTFYWVRVDRYLRGKGPMLLRLYSENTTSRFPMDLHQPYVLFVNKNPEHQWVVDNCGNSAIMSKAGATMTALEQIPLQRSYIYGSVYFYGGDGPCNGMQLIVQRGDFSKTTPVDSDCSFHLDVPPGRYEASLMKGTEKILSNELNYKDIYCFAVPAGGSAGIAFRGVDGAGKASLDMNIKVDREYKALCTGDRIPGTVFLP